MSMVIRPTKIKDNFLAQEDFDKLQNFMCGSNSKMYWFYNNMIVDADDVDNFKFSHTFYDAHSPQSSFMGVLNPILNIIKPLSILRIKANLLTRTSNIVENQFHIDIVNLQHSPELLNQWTTSIFYLNTNNGYSKFEDGTIVESVANRMVSFPSSTKHCGASCTNEKIRVVLNFNYFENTPKGIEMIEEVEKRK